MSTKIGRIITFVKKVDKHGNDCNKCSQIQKQMEKDNILDKIDRIEVIDESNTKNTMGKVLASKYNIKTAPFFVVTIPDKESSEVYKYYTSFKTEFTKVSDNEKIKDIFDRNFSNDIL